MSAKLGFSILGFRKVLFSLSPILVFQSSPTQFTRNIFWTVVNSFHKDKSFRNTIKYFPSLLLPHLNWFLAHLLLPASKWRHQLVEDCCLTTDWIKWNSSELSSSTTHHPQTCKNHHHLQDSPPLLSSPSTILTAPSSPDFQKVACFFHVIVVQSVWLL